jgi:predicted alpha/beta-hydrolase family hydrolase
MSEWKRRLETLGRVATFDYPYMVAGRRRPDPLPKLIEAHRAALDAIPRKGSSPVVLMGKSMGSRVGCHVAAAGDESSRRVRALVCFGYPLRGQSGKLRDEVLRELSVPILFVQGTRDALCPLDALAKARRRMTAASEVHVVEDGDHSLAVAKRTLARAGETQADVDARILTAVRDFLGRTIDG